MPTSTKPRKTKQPTKQTPYRFPRTPRGAAQPARRRPSFPGMSSKPSGKASPTLIGRARASVPGRKPKSKKNGGLGSAIAGLASSLGSAKNGARAHKPPKKGLVGIVAGAGLGAAAVAKRRRGGQPDPTVAPPPEPTSAGNAGESPTIT
jgi:hypothetical protein